MSDQHALQPDVDPQPDEDNSLLESVEGRPGIQADPDPAAFAADVEAGDPEDDAA